MKAKKIPSILLLLFIVVSSVSSAFAQEPTSSKHFILDGTIKGQGDGVIYIRYADRPGKYMNASAPIKDGHFHLQGHTSEPAIAFLTTAKNKLPDDDDRIISANGKKSVVFFLAPAEMQASLDTADFEQAIFTGSQAQTEFAAFNQQAKTENALRGFIDQHPDSYVSAWLVTLHHFPLDTLQHFYNSFTSKVQNSASGKAILDKLHNKELVVVGKRAPAFRQNDKNGKKVALKDFRGRYVLLQFWSSWSTACKVQNIALRRVYDQFKSKNFTIIGASLDGQKTRKIWSAAADSLPWIQLVPLKAKDNPAAIKYSVETMPTNFLIDPAGKIIATDLNGEALEKFLTRIFVTLDHH